MVDYVRSLGSQEGSQMMIRDRGTTVEFWVKSGSAGTWTANMPFGWTVNGKSGSDTIPYNYPWPGHTYPTPGPWVKCKSFTVKTTQTVTFRIGATQTTGLNGPTEFQQLIERSSAWVRSGGVWKQAEVYVKVSGTWKRAEAWVRSGGSWKRTG